VRELEPGGPRAEIFRRIEKKGPITFAEFMAVAMYWPQGGYYTSGREPWGQGGDYITSTDVSPVFARMMAVAVGEAWEALGEPAPFVLIEAGAGRGHLSRGILGALKESLPGLYEAMSVVLVDKGPGGEGGEGDGGDGEEKVTLLHEMPRPGSVDHGLVLSNELIDSFPFHRLRQDGGVLREIYVGLEDGRLVDMEGPPSTGALEAYFEEAGITLVEGQVAEVNLLAGPWLKETASIFEKGFVITIDYGLPASELYGMDRLGGTLMCHYLHKPNFEPYERIGAQDITSHVDFTNLARCGEEAGLRVCGFTTQKNFLLGLGVLEELVETEGGAPGDFDKIQHNRALAMLIAPGGMGDTFKVLVQEKGLDTPPALRGFSFRDMRRYL